MTTPRDQRDFGRPREEMLSRIPENRRIFTVADTAGLLRCKEQDVYNFIYTGQLSAVNIATRPQLKAMYRIYREDLVRFIRAQQAGAP